MYIRETNVEVRLTGENGITNEFTSKIYDITTIPIQVQSHLSIAGSKGAGQGVVLQTAFLVTDSKDDFVWVPATSCKLSRIR